MFNCFQFFLIPILLNRLLISNSGAVLFCFMRNENEERQVLVVAIIPNCGGLLYSGRVSVFFQFVTFFQYD